MVLGTALSSCTRHFFFINCVHFIDYSPLVNLHQSGGKTQTALCKEYGVSQTALTRWIKQYATVETDDGEVMTAKQVKELQRRLAQLEEENLILKKAIAIFTPHSDND